MATIAKFMGVAIADLSSAMGVAKAALSKIMGLDLPTPIEDVLDLVGLGSISGDCNYLFYPADPSHGAGDKHYLYTGAAWEPPEVLDTTMGIMYGVMTADGTGGSLSYTPEIIDPTTAEGISVLYTNAGVVVPILSMGFNRALTAGERTALAGLITPIAATAGVAAGSCSLVTGAEFQQRCLKMKVNTALAGSANDTFILPADGTGTYAYTVTWDHNSRQYVTANTSQTHDYDVSVTRIITVYGTYRPYFAGAGDRLKVLMVQIGAPGATTMSNAFQGCAALTEVVGYSSMPTTTSISYAWYDCIALTSFPVIDTSAVQNFSHAWQNCFNLTSFPLIDTGAGAFFAEAWYDCRGLTSFPLIDTGLGQDFAQAWYGCTGLTSFPLIDTGTATSIWGAWKGCTGLTSFPALDTSLVQNFSQAWLGCSGLTTFPVIDVGEGTNFYRAWYTCSGLQASFAAFDITNATNVTEMFGGCNINAPGTTDNYDNTLIAWAALDLTNTLQFSAGTSQYGGDAGSGGQQARAAIIADDFWTIADGGHI